MSTIDAMNTQSTLAHPAVLNGVVNSERIHQMMLDFGINIIEHFNENQDAPPVLMGVIFVNDNQYMVHQMDPEQAESLSMTEAGRATMESIVYQMVHDPSVQRQDGSLVRFDFVFTSVLVTNPGKNEKQPSGILMIAHLSSGRYTCLCPIEAPKGSLMEAAPGEVSAFEPIEPSNPEGDGVIALLQTRSVHDFHTPSFQLQ